MRPKIARVTFFKISYRVMLQDADYVNITLYTVVAEQKDSAVDVRYARGTFLCTCSGELTATVTGPDQAEVPTKVARHDTVYDVSFMPSVVGEFKLTDCFTSMISKHSSS